MSMLYEVWNGEYNEYAVETLEKKPYIQLKGISMHFI